jgi:DNA-binding Lrp family transcriptional regulator
MTDTVSLDALDRKILHALQLDGRVPFRALAAALGASENTVARRFRRLSAGGGVRVVGAVRGARLGRVPWALRLRCAPDAALAVARALAARPDTSWVHLLSGGTELACSVQARGPGESDALLLQALPKGPRAVAITAQMLLQSFALPTTWRGLQALSPAQEARLRRAPACPGAGPPDLDRADRALLEALGRDGRAPYAELAAAAGVSEVTARRRLERLLDEGVLDLQLEVPPPLVGFHVEARLWAAVEPSALARVAAALARCPEVTFGAVTTGATNLVAAVSCHDAEHLYRFLTERIAGLEGIRTLETAPVMRTVKRVGPLGGA